MIHPFARLCLLAAFLGCVAHLGPASAQAPSSPPAASSFTGSKWSGGEGFSIEFRVGGDYREFWRGGEYPGTWKELPARTVEVARRDGWHYVFHLMSDGGLRRVWKPMPGQAQQEEIVFRRLAPAASTARAAVAAPAVITGPVFQVRQVVKEVTADSEEMTIPDSKVDPKYWEQFDVKVRAKKTILMDQTSVKSATAHHTNMGLYVLIQFTPEGAARFAEITRENKGGRLAFVVDGALRHVYRVASEDRRGEIGMTCFNGQQAALLAGKIMGQPPGPAPLTPSEQLRFKAEQGDAKAQAALGESLRFGGALVEKADLDEALKWLRKSAEQNCAEGQFQLGDLYLRRCRSPDKSEAAKNSAEAQIWLRKAAAQGHVEAHLGLCELHAEGLGVPTDRNEAHKWLVKLADEVGEPGAQLMVGMKLIQGAGEKTPAKAVEWIRRAANQGMVEAQAALGHLYGGHEGAARDDVEAYYWNLVAGLKGAGRTAIEESAQKLTPEQRAEVEKRAAGFKPKLEREPVQKR